MRARDLVVLGWCCEQYAARTDQLEVLLGSGPRTVQRVIARLRDAGLIDDSAAARGGARVGDPDERGVARGGAGVRGVASSDRLARARRGGQRRAPARPGPLAARANGCPSACSLEERQSGEHLPDGVVITEGQRVAIEVELTVKSQRRVTAILDELSGRFDTVAVLLRAGTAPAAVARSRRAGGGRRSACASCPPAGARASS